MHIVIVGKDNKPKPLCLNRTLLLEELGISLVTVHKMYEKQICIDFEM